ncbi:hypothetical protein BV25DRAFT_1921187 [Artomyces pyxidatus]|uniref:Uncharacterized protein n=1 Tax=Artomyces pyxidatus TaxID=48021 RepID=A0ACB8SI09_9AGAM|nr:hypothetical protein BV25DRAFT_1921187 [Artomyces pyxidatus]
MSLPISSPIISTQLSDRSSRDDHPSHSVRQLDHWSLAVPDATAQVAGRVFLKRPTVLPSPLAPIGVEAALAGAPAEPKSFAESTLTDRIVLVSGANRGLGLEMALTLAKAGARAVYCVDLPAALGAEWEAVRAHVAGMGLGWVGAAARVRER